MKSKGNIVFLGMMGSGKTSIGKLISKKIGLEFFDIDEYIEKSLKMKISKIFIVKGEKFFRDVEERITLEILNKKDCIIALGGGAFLNKKIRQEILLNHVSFWLNWSSEILVSRIKNSSKRPIAYNLTKKEIIDLIRKRSNIYSKALYKLDCNYLTKNQIVKKVLNMYEINKINN